MSTEFTIREGRDIRELFGSGRATWAGSGAAKLGLTGDVKPENFEALAELAVGQDVDQADEVGPYEAKPAGGLSLMEQMRRDGTLERF
jgi:hypothetical protein